MRLTLFVLLLLITFALGSDPLAFAATTYQIKIPSGASDPNAPFFWSEKSTGVTTGEITVYPGDTVSWENADAAFHTITSITPTGEIDMCRSTWTSLMVAIAAQKTPTPGGHQVAGIVCRCGQD